MVSAKQITEREALLNINSNHAKYYANEQISCDDQCFINSFGSGTAAYPGVVKGRLAFTDEQAIKLLNNDESVIMCLSRTNANKISLSTLRAASGLLDLDSNIQSLTPCIFRCLGKPCIVASKNLTLLSVNDEESQLVSNIGEVMHAGDLMTMDGGHGKIFNGCLHTSFTHQLDFNFQTVLKFADNHRKLKILTTINGANAVNEIEISKKIGFDGIGCLSTDSLFFHSDERLFLMRSILLRTTIEQKNEALNLLEKIHANDFVNIFRLCTNFPVCVKLLDVSLSSFLIPDKNEKEMLEIALKHNISIVEVKKINQTFHDSHATDGLKGARISELFPEITKMQVISIVSAALQVFFEKKIAVKPKILIPMLSTSRELENILNLIKETATEVIFIYLFIIKIYYKKIMYEAIISLNKVFIIYILNNFIFSLLLLLLLRIIINNFFIFYKKGIQQLPYRSNAKKFAEL
jgi:pyruvate,orthophosphate dikinase